MGKVPKCYNISYDFFYGSIYLDKINYLVRDETNESVRTYF